jgi:hypothetical protein
VCLQVKYPFISKLKTHNTTVIARTIKARLKQNFIANVKLEQNYTALLYIPKATVGEQLEKTLLEFRLGEFTKPYITLDIRL